MLPGAALPAYVALIRVGCLQAGRVEGDEPRELDSRIGAAGIRRGSSGCELLRFGL